MGGNAFKNINIVRMNNVEFKNVSKKLVNILKDILNSEEVAILPYYDNKPFFSDVDIMLCNEDISNFEKENNVNFFEYCNKLFSGEGIAINNDSLVSIAVPINKAHTEFAQVDLMPHPRENFYKNLIFYGYNDLNVLVNRFISIPLFNAKYTSDGVEINIYREKGNIDMLLGIAKTENSALEYLSFLDLDINKFKKGFSTKEEIFDFILSSKYFDTNTFNSQIKINNSSEKLRLRRDVYRTFIDYVKDKDFKSGTKVIDSLEVLFDNFDTLKKQSEMFFKQYDDYIIFKQRFNTENINAILGLESKDLIGGKVIKTFLKEREVYKNKELIETVNRMNDEEFKNMLNERRLLINEKEKANIKSKKRIL